MTWEQCGYFKHRFVDMSGKIVGRVERDHNQEWHAYGAGGLVGVYVSEEKAKAAIEREQFAALGSAAPQQEKP